MKICYRLLFEGNGFHLSYSKCLNILKVKKLKVKMQLIQTSLLVIMLVLAKRMNDVGATLILCLDGKMAKACRKINWGKIV